MYWFSLHVRLHMYLILLPKNTKEYERIQAVYLCNVLKLLEHFCWGRAALTSNKSWELQLILNESIGFGSLFLVLFFLYWLVAFMEPYVKYLIHYCAYSFLIWILWICKVNILIYNKYVFWLWSNGRLKVRQGEEDEVDRIISQDSGVLVLIPPAFSLTFVLLFPRYPTIKWGY